MEQLSNKDVGPLGEEIACKFLMKHGFSIIEQNYLKKCGEIDIVAKRGDLLHFIEVKSVSHEKTNEYRPEENIHRNKLKRLSKTIQIYLAERKVRFNVMWQIDAVMVYISKEKKTGQVHYLPNIIVD